VISELDLRSQLLTGFELAAFDLPAQIFGDLRYMGFAVGLLGARYLVTV
jgi:hypothetical protein